MAVQQLRIYEIDPAKRGAFLRRFEQHAVRIMRGRYGFTILATWESRNDDALEFVYLLHWPDRETMTRQWAAYLADPEWERIKREIRAEVGGEPVQRHTSRVLDEAPFSPHVMHLAAEATQGESNT